MDIFNWLWFDLFTHRSLFENTFIINWTRRIKNIETLLILYVSIKYIKYNIAIVLKVYTIGKYKYVFSLFSVKFVS